MATKYLVQSGADNVTKFATIYEWLASLPTTLTEPETLEAGGDFSYARSATNGENLTNAITTSAANYLRIYVPPQYRHDGRPRSVSGKGFRITDATQFSITAKHVRLEGIDLDINAVTALNVASGASSDVRIDGCFVKNSATDTSYTILCTAAGTTAAINNTIAYGSSRSIDTRGALSVIANNSVFWRDTDNLGVVCTGEFKAYNCYSGKATGTSADWLNQAAVVGTNNASSDATATSAFGSGNGNLNNIAGSAVFKSIVAGTRDFNLATGTNALVDAGTASTGLTSDAIGTNRPQGAAYDIGALERFTAGPPSPPSGVTATAQDRSADVAFTPGGSNGSATTGFTVTASTGQTATGTASPIHVPGLPAGTAVTFTVTQTNGLGTSAASAPSNSVTPFSLVPDAPTGVTATAGAGYADVVFTPGDTKGVTGGVNFTVTASTGQTATGTGSPIRVSSLTPGTAVTFTVTETTSAGTSPASSASNSVTPTVPLTPPTGVFTKVQADGDTVIIEIDTTNSPTSGTVSMQPAGSNPGGAVAQGPTALALTTGKATATWANVPPGSYATPIATLYNASAPAGVAATGGNGITIADITQPVPDTTPPTLTGTISVTNLTATTATVTCPAATDNVAVMGYEYSLTGAAPFLNLGASQSVNLTGLAPSSAVPITFQSYDAAGNRSAPLSTTFTTPAPPISGTVPGAPTNVVATLGAGVVIVGFSPPSSNGGQPITGYTVTASSGQAANVLTSPAIMALPIGVEVSFTVRAKNSIGPSSPSVPSNSVTPIGITTSGPDLPHSTNDAPRGRTIRM